MKEEKNILVRHWIEKSYNALEAAKINFEQNFYETAINRLYYSAFYMIIAYLQLEGISYKKHSAIRSFFNRKFVKENLLEKHYSNVYNSLYQIREEADYSLTFEIEKDKLKWYINQTEKLIKEIEKIIKEKMEKGI